MTRLLLDAEMPCDIEDARFRKRPLQLQGDGGEEAAGTGALFAVAEEERGMAGGAEI
jgi:hypothetical protein